MNRIPLPSETDRPYVVHSIIILLLLSAVVWRITSSLLWLALIPITYFICMALLANDVLITNNVVLNNISKPILKYISAPYFVVVSALDKFKCPVGCVVKEEGDCDCVDLKNPKSA